MTKRDLRSVTVAGGLGLAGFLALWYLFRRTVKVPVLQPTQVKFEGP